MKINLRKIDLKAVINKANGQINFSMPKKKIDKKVLDKIQQNKSITFLMEEVE